MPIVDCRFSVDNGDNPLRLGISRGRSGIQEEGVVNPGIIPTALPGITFGSTFRHLAGLADKFTVIRSYRPGSGDHDLKPLVHRDFLNANLGLTPSNDGKAIRLNLPPLTEERRKEIVKGLKKKAEEDKIAIRNIRRDAIDKLKKLEKDKAVTEDELKKFEKEVQDITKSFELKMDEAVAHKEKEVMEV